MNPGDEKAPVDPPNSGSSPKPRAPSWSEFNLSEDSSTWGELPIDSDGDARAGIGDLTSDSEILIRPNSLIGMLEETVESPESTAGLGPAHAVEAKPSTVAEIALPHIVYDVVIHALADRVAENVRVEHEMPEGPSFVAGQPSPRVQGRRLIWDLGKMEAGATRSLRVILQPSGTPDLSPDSVAVFEVRHYSRVTVNLREPAKPAPADEPYLLMRIGGATYGMPASQVAEIRTLISSETVPTHVDWNGTRFPVVDPRVPLGWPTDAATTRRRLVLACASGRHAAMIVDRTIGLRFLGSGASIACSSRSLRPHVSGFASLAGRLVSLLDLESVLAALQDTV